MAISEAYAGSELVSTTEWSLTTDTAGPDVDTNDGVYQVFLDLSALAKADAFTLRVYEKVQATDTQRVVFRAFFANAQSEPVFVTPSLILLHGWDVTLVKTAGTDRTITWSIRKVAQMLWWYAPEKEAAALSTGPQQLDAVTLDTTPTLEQSTLQHRILANVLREWE